jgi:signal transduction histidine kinase
MELAQLGTDPGWGRTQRDRRVAASGFVLALAAAAATVTGDLMPGPPAGRAFLAADLAGGVLACAALWLCRRWPAGMATLIIAVSVLATSASAAAGMATLYVALYRRAGAAAAVGALGVTAALIRFAVRPPAVAPYWLWAAVAVLSGAALTGWGMLARARRLLMLSLRERAERAEAQQRERVAQARRAERDRIAREMHDVLGHRLSLLAIHAGALEFHPGAAAEEITAAAAVIRAAAHDALNDLREVVTLLRDGRDGDDPGDGDHPQPGLADLPALVEESRRAGTPVVVHQRVADPAAVPAALGRAAYRIVREALTNARKHAPGQPATLTIRGGPGAGLSVEARNRLATGPGSALDLPGTGTGLVGLAERASLAGGRLEHDRTAAGEFRLSAWLPWPP